MGRDKNKKGSHAKENTEKRRSTRTSTAACEDTNVFKLKMNVYQAAILNSSFKHLSNVLRLAPVEESDVFSPSQSQRSSVPPVEPLTYEKRAQLAQINSELSDMLIFKFKMKNEEKQLAVPELIAKTQKEKQNIGQEVVEEKPETADSKKTASFPDLEDEKIEERKDPFLENLNDEVENMIDLIAAKNIPDKANEIKENQGKTYVVEPFERERAIAEEVKKARQVLLTKYIPEPKPEIQIIKRIPSYYQARQMVSDLFQTINQHKGAYLFNQPLDPNHQLFHEMKHDFITLNMIEIYFKIGKKFKTTSELGMSIRSMIVQKFKINVGNTDLSHYNLIQSFFEEFETQFKDMENLRLVKPSEQIDPTSESHQKHLQEKEQNNDFRTNKVYKALEQLKDFQENQKFENFTNGVELSVEEKIELTKSINLLTHEQKKGIIDVVKDALPKYSNGQTVFEFDINRLPTSYQLKLKQYVNQSILMNARIERRRIADRIRHQKNASERYRNDSIGCQKPSTNEEVKDPNIEQVLTQSQLQQLVEFQAVNPQFMPNQAAILASKQPQNQFQNETQTKAKPTRGGNLSSSDSSDGLE